MARTRSHSSSSSPGPQPQPQPSPPSPLSSPPPQTQPSWRQQANQIGELACGELWPTVCESIQDAIALALLVALPSWIFRQITGQDYSGYDVCMQGNSWFSVDRYACLVIVTADLSGWIVLAGRVLQRFIRALQLKGGSNAKSP